MWRKTDDSLVRLADGSLRLMQEARQHYPDFDITRTWALPEIPVAAGDEALEVYLRRIGFSDAQISYTRRSWANAAGADPSQLSAAASLAEMTDESSGTGDYRVLDGYDCVPSALADGLDIRLNSPVVQIDWRGSVVRVTTASSVVYEADRVIVTLPLGVLKRGGIMFTPELPAEKQAAIQGLGMGAGMKLIYRFRQPVLPAGVMAWYSALNPPMWWSPSFGHDGAGDEQVITAFVTGDYAASLHALGEAGALEAGLKTLQTELARPVQPDAMHCVNWIDDPYSCGAYSYVPVGAVGLREALARPLHDRLYWAGEATAPNAFAATVHGAYTSGVRAAQEILFQRHAN